MILAIAYIDDAPLERGLGCGLWKTSSHWRDSAFLSLLLTFY